MTSEYKVGQTVKLTMTENHYFARLMGPGTQFIGTIEFMNDFEMYVRIDASEFDKVPASLRGEFDTRVRLAYETKYPGYTVTVEQPEPVQPKAAPEAVAEEAAKPEPKKPVYTIDIEDVDWHRDNVAAWGSGRIEMGSPKGSLEKQVGKNTLIVEFIKHRPGALEDTPQEIVEILAAHLVNAEGVEFAPPDLIARIEIAGHRRIWNGAYVDDAWLSASEIASKYSLATATVRQAINRAVASGKTPTWARKSAGTWLIERDEADRRWGNRNG